MLRLPLIGLLLLASSLVPAKPASTPSDLEPVEGVRIDESAIRTGDLVFRRGRTWLSRAVVEVDPASSFSHVGLAVVDDGVVSVVHATPGEDGGAEAHIAGVVLEPLSRYLAPGSAKAVGVWRVADERAASEAAETARGWARKAVPFDGSFEADYGDASADALYCTELVWRAYLHAGIDLLGGHLDTLQLPLGPDRYVLPSSLLASAHVSEIPVAQLHGGDP